MARNVLESRRVAVTPDGVAATGLTGGPRLRRRTRLRPAPRIPFARALGPILLLVIWQLGAWLDLIDPDTLPSPAVVGEAAWTLIENGDLVDNLAISVQRAMLGLLVGVSLAVIVALIAGLSRVGESLFDGSVQVLRALPVLALVPLAILWFGIGEEVKVILVAIGTFVPVYINVQAALVGLDSRYVELAESVHLSRTQFIRRVALPGALPAFFTGLRLSVTISWLVLVVSEQINASSGIGYLMAQARTFARTDVIIVGLIVYGLLGLLSDTLVLWIERKVLAWRKGIA